VSAPGPDVAAFVRYLRAKEPVDDGALHRPTLDRFSAELDRLAAAGDGPVRVVDVGAGVGSMCRRLLSWDRLPTDVEYVVLDRSQVVVDAACEVTREWAASVETATRWTGDTLHLPARETTVRFVAAEAVDHLAGSRYDALVAHAFADLIDLPDGLSSLLDGVVSGGVCYFPVTFDGVTAFLPADPEADRAVLDAYHAAMDDSSRPGAARSGRALLDAVAGSDAGLLAAGGSDWVVHPPYEGDEAYFLRHVLQFVEGAVGGGDRVDAETLSAWLADRRGAVDEGALTYLAHNLDVCCRAP
jgi:hypothetical protein